MVIPINFPTQSSGVLVVSSGICLHVSKQILQYFALSFLDVIYWLLPAVIVDFTSFLLISLFPYISLISLFLASLPVYGDITFFLLSP